MLRIAMDVAPETFAFAPLLIILLLAAVAVVVVVFLLRFVRKGENEPDSPLLVMTLVRAGHPPADGQPRQPVLSRSRATASPPTSSGGSVGLGIAQS